MAETVLQYRLDNNPAYEEQLRDVRREVRKMIFSGVYQSGIAHKLIKKESYQVRAKLLKRMETSPAIMPQVGIQIQCI